jgi:hypothetical protein
VIWDTKCWPRRKYTNSVEFLLVPAHEVLKNPGIQSFPASAYYIKKQQHQLLDKLLEKEDKVVPRAWDEIIMAIEL